MLFDPVHELFAVGYVSRNFGKTVRLSFFVLQGGYYNARPEARTVFPDAPAFVFEAAFLRRHPELVLGLFRLLLALGVEDGEMLSQDLIGGVTLETLRARVPRDHVPFRVEQKDGVVAD